MAGSSGNWFKTGRGSAKGRVFISNATIRSALQMTPGESLAAIKAEMRAMAESNADTLGALAAMSPQPAGQAKASNDAISTPTDVMMASIDAPSATSTPPAEFAKYPRIYDWARDGGDDAVALAELQAGMESWRTPESDAADSPLDRAMQDAFGAANPNIKMTPTMIDALGSYQYTNYRMINAILWDGMLRANGKLDHQKAQRAAWKELRNKAKGNVTRGLAKDVEAEYQRLLAADNGAALQLWKNAYKRATTLDTMLSKMGAPFQFTATRSQGRDHPLYAAMASMGVGDTFASVGFESASIDPGNEWMGGDIVVDYQIPQGAPGAYLNGIKGFDSSASDELEWLIPAGAKWTVVDKTIGAGGRMRVTLGLVGVVDPFTGESRW